MKKLGLLTASLAAMMGLVACNNQPSGPVGPKYTVESAANAVCDKLNAAFELEGEDKITPTKDSDDEYYIVLNLGDGLTEDQLMTFVDNNLLVEDFTAKTATWNQEEDEGIVFNFRDFQWEKVLLEYVVYERSGSENPGYDGMYLLIESLRSFKDWADSEDIEYYLGVKGASFPQIEIPAGGEYRWRFYPADPVEETIDELVLITWWNSEAAFDAALKAANWTYRSIGGGYYGYFNEEATLFAMVSYYEDYDATQISIFNVDDLFE